MDKEKDKTEAEELKRKGNEAFSKGEYLEAKQLYTKAIGILFHTVELNPNEFAYYGNRSACNLSLQLYLLPHSCRYEECIRDCEMALSLNGKFSKGYARLAKSYLALGNYERARELYEKAMEVAPTDKQLVAESKQCAVVRRS